MLVNQLTDGQDVDLVLLVRDREVRTNREGVEYLKLGLGDRTGSVSALIMDGVPEVRGICEAGAAIRVQGSYSVHVRYGPQLAGWRRTPVEAWATGGESLLQVETRVRPALGAVLARLAAAGQPGSHDRPQVAGYGDPHPSHPWTIVVGHDGVFKVALLTLFDLPLERFWMFTMGLTGMTVVEVRGGRPVLRAANLTEHLAPLLDEEALAAAERRTRSGAL